MDNITRAFLYFFKILAAITNKRLYLLFYKNCKIFEMRPRGRGWHWVALTLAMSICAAASVSAVDEP